MKILITGAGGWLGSELTEQLLERGEKIKALVLGTSEKLKLLKEKYKDRLEIVEGDVCSEKIIEEVLDEVEKVFHLAAKVHCQPKNKKDVDDFFRINTEASKILFNKCLEKNIKRVVFYSSVSVYGESENIINVSSPKNPITPYAKSKLEAEEYAMKLYKEKGLPITIIQPVTVYGGDDVGNFEKMRTFAQKGLLPRFGDGNNKKTIIYFKDLIEATIKIAYKEEFIGQSVICGTEVISINEINEVLKKGCKKVKLIKVNKKLSVFLEKLLASKILFILNTISRQIHVLRSNSEFNIEQTKVLFETNMNFKMYYGKEK